MKKIMMGMFRGRSPVRTGVSIFAVTAVWVCSLAITGSQQKWRPTQKGSYGKMTRDALNHLLVSAEKLRAGDPAAAKKELQGMQSSVDELTTAAGFFREQANRESDRCVSHIGILENRVAEIYQQELKVKNGIDDLDAQLAGITQRKTLTENEITKLRNSVQITEQKLRERERKLDELRKWWWVPFYNLYLGIRTLVDDDIGNYNSLKNTLDDASTQMARHQHEFQAAQTMREALSKERETMRKTQAGLQEMRTGAEAELANLKKSAVFLTDAGVFWQRVSRLLKIDVSQSLELAKEIQDLELDMTKENSAPRFDNLQQRPVMGLYDSLSAFADTIDQGKNFLDAPVTDYCGGEPRKTGGPDVSSSCNINASSYEIINPKTCTFRYVNPTGCPPRPRPVLVTDEAVAARKLPGTWSRADGQNWVGRERCDATNSIYYGKVANQDACERKCMSDSTCVAWTFNDRNGHIGMDSLKECWGGTRTLSSHKVDWPGYQSGGTIPEGVECSVFDIGYTNLAGPSDAIFFNNQHQACIPGAGAPTCRKRFGRCRTVRTHVPVNFKGFEDGYANIAGPSNAIGIGLKAVISEGSPPTYRKLFGRGVADDGRTAVCRVFNDGYTNESKLGDAIFVNGATTHLGDIPACLAGSAGQGTCKKWWGRCQVQ